MLSLLPAVCSFVGLVGHVAHRHLGPLGCRMSAIPHQLNPTGFVVPYELRSSSIAGLGLFATTHIARGTLLWKADHKSQIAHTEAQLRAKLATLSRAEAVDLLEHIYCWGGEVLEIVGDAKFWNHSRVKQNTGNHPDGNSGGQGDGLSSYALRDIEPAEEFLDDYAAYSKVPWFEALCLEYGAVSCTSIGKQFM